MYLPNKHMARYMEISMYLALCLVASTKLTEITPIADKFAKLGKINTIRFVSCQEKAVF